MTEANEASCHAPIVESVESRTLTLERSLAAPRRAIWRCWTEPALLKQWFCPAPWKVTEAQVELRPGGRNRVVMQGPQGETHPHQGVYLEIVANERLVFTDAFVDAWTPSNKAFMVGRVELADAPGGGTLYRASAIHWTLALTREHEAMGFHAGWGVCADQLDALARTL